MTYAYWCPNCGTIEVEIRSDKVACLECKATAKRVWAVTLDRHSTKHTGRYDPQVGQYVRNEREFHELLKAGAERQEQELNMAVPLATVDARDDQALAEIHGTGMDHRLEVREQTARKLHDEKVKANKESKPKVLTS